MKINIGKKLTFSETHAILACARLSDRGHDPRAWHRLTPFQRQERRCQVATLCLGLSLCRTNQMSRPPSKGTRSILPLRRWIPWSNPHPLPALPPSPTGFTLIGALRSDLPHEFLSEWSELFT